MRIKTYAKVLISVILLASLAACGNSKQLEAEKKSLQTENEALKAQVKQLTDENGKFKAELEDLKQTDQYLFSKAKELASSNARDAKELLDKFLTKFPNSAYKGQATGLLRDVNNKIAIADAVENGESEITSAILSYEFGKAWSTLRSIKKYIPTDKYAELANTIADAQNKPISLTLSDLLSNKGKYLKRKVIIKGFMFSNHELFENFIFGDDSTNKKFSVYYGHLSQNTQKEIMQKKPNLNIPGSEIPVTVTGTFAVCDGEACEFKRDIKADEVYFR